MKIVRTITLCAVASIALTSVAVMHQASAIDRYHRADRLARYYSAQRPWHGNYSYTQWGGPVPLVVPPTARTHVSYSWGVSQTEVQPIYHQFHRNYPGPINPVYGGGAPNYLPTPYWPSHTDQLGVYPIRGPW